MASHHCSVCKKPSEQSCSICNQVYYCSKEHQIQDWKKVHKNNCSPFKVLTNDTLGRYIIATRDIPEGDIVLKRKPLVICPKTVSNPLCLGCHKKINIVEEMYNCSKCSWPLCGLECENTDLHKEECEIMTKKKFKPKIIPDNVKQSCYSIIGPLRVLLLKTKANKNKFDTIMNMQSHLEIHKNSPLYSILRKNIVPIIIGVLKIDTSEDEILRICSIFDTNAFDVRDSKGLVNVRALYSTVSFIAHDCKQNTRHYFTENNFDINVSSTIAIKKGDTLTTSYTQSLWGTLARRAHLKQMKNFYCSCDRCKDPTEFGLYVGSIYCSGCRESNKADECPKMINIDPLNSDADYQCESCGRVMMAKQVSWGNDALRKEILSLDKTNPARFEAFLDRYKDLLHPTNSHVLDVKYALSQMYGNLNGYYLPDLGDDLIKRKIDICHELLYVADILCPGFSRFRGSLLYDLQAAMVIQARRDYEKEKITKQHANVRFDNKNGIDTLLESISILQESAKILSVEPDMKNLLEKRLESMSDFLD